jgi:type IV pilus assembly protein PilC
MASYGEITTSSLPSAASQVELLNTNRSLVSASGKPSSPAKLKVPQKDLLIFFRQLAVVLQSGVPLAQGLGLLAENTKNKQLSLCILAIGTRLGAGEELSQCLRQYPRVFAPITIGLIEAGEAGGILDQVLDRIAKLMEDQAKIRGQIIGALIYPILVLVLALSVSLGLLIFIVPRFKAMFDNMGAELPGLTSFMLGLSNFVTSPAFAIGAPVALAGSIYLFRGYYATKPGRLAIDSSIFSIPLFGDLILKSEMASMCDTLSTLVNSGIPIVDSLERCITASSNQLIRNTIQRGIIMVGQGQELSYSLSANGVMPRLVISMIKIGEETGQLSFMLENLSVFYKRELDNAVSALTKAMEPTVIFVVAGIVGTIVISLYLPMFSLIQNMGK